MFSKSGRPSDSSDRFYASLTNKNIQAFLTVWDGCLTF